jgi:5-methylcytosine-specific restriction enzyme A
MPCAAPHLCSYPGCTILVKTYDSRCEKHRIQERQESEGRRGSAAQRGYGAKWRSARKAFLRRSPLCAECQSKGILKAAAVVDHIIPHKGNSGLFWDESNWQVLCKRCHDIKTARKDGRWR